MADPLQVRFNPRGSDQPQLSAFLFKATTTCMHDDTRRQRPIIIMAPGEIGSHALERGNVIRAQSFQNAGINVLLFDYLHWGQSEGLPRHNFDPEQQLLDWQSAIDFAKHLSFVDIDKIILLGSYISANYVLSIVSNNLSSGIWLCLIEAPILDFSMFASKMGLTCMKNNLKVTLFKGIPSMIKDEFRKYYNSDSEKPPVYVNIFAPKSSPDFGLLLSDEMYASFERAFNATFRWIELDSEQKTLDCKSIPDHSSSHQLLSEEDLDALKIQLNQITARSIRGLLHFSHRIKYKIEDIQIPCLFQYMKCDQFQCSTFYEKATMKNPIYLSPKGYDGDFFGALSYSEKSLWKDLHDDQIAFIARYMKKIIR